MLLLYQKVMTEIVEDWKTILSFIFLARATEGTLLYVWLCQSVSLSVCQSVRFFSFKSYNRDFAII